MGNITPRITWPFYKEPNPNIDRDRYERRGMTIAVNLWRINLDQALTTRKRCAQILDPNGEQQWVARYASEAFQWLEEHGIDRYIVSAGPLLMVIETRPAREPEE